MPGWHLGEKANSDLIRYKFIISSRNNYFIELLSMRKVNNEWRQAWRLYSGSESSKAIKQQFDPDFPRDKTGKIDY